MMTKDQYIESLRKLKLNLYMFGEKVENPVDNPVIRPSLNSFAATYELAEDPQYEDLMTATSHITGKKINRFTHMPVDRRPDQEGQDAAPARPEDRSLLPALRWYGRNERRILLYLRD